ALDLDLLDDAAGEGARALDAEAGISQAVGREAGDGQLARLGRSRGHNGVIFDCHGVSHRPGAEAGGDKAALLRAEGAIWTPAGIKAGDEHRPVAFAGDDDAALRIHRGAVEL